MVTTLENFIAGALRVTENLGKSVLAIYVYIDYTLDGNRCELLLKHFEVIFVLRYEPLPERCARAASGTRARANLVAFETSYHIHGLTIITGIE